MNTKQRAGLYARVSSQEQATEGVSIEAQVAALRAYVKSQGWEVADEYIDGGYSGGTDDRPALKRLLVDASQRRFTIVAVCKLDRFFRNLRLLLNHLHGLEQLGIKFVSTQEGLDTSTPYGKFAVQIMGVIAEFERGRIGERVRDSRRYLISGGSWPGGRTVYGYRWLPDERRWEVVPEEAGIVRRVYDLYVKNRIGIDAIAAALNKDGVRTRDGAEWRYSTIRKMLVHPGYKGQHQIGIPMPPIIDESTWQQAQQKREDARSVLADPKGWLLQGMCFCGKCGHVLKCMRKRPGEPSYYACRGRVSRNSRDGGKRCELPYVRADWLERGVWEKVRDILRDQETLAKCVNKALVGLEEKKSQIGAATLAIDNKLDTIRAKKERLGLAFADGAVQENVYKSKLNQLKKQEAAVLKCRHNIDPAQMGELTSLEGRISAIKNILSEGSLILSEFGIFAATLDEYAPVGFNAWRESDGRSAIGEVTGMDTLRIIGFHGWRECGGKPAIGKVTGKDTFWEKGRNIVVRGIDAPPEYWECNDRERDEKINRNLRALFQFFGIKVFVFPERVEIRGDIPTQMLDISTRKQAHTAPIIISPSLRKGGGSDMKEELRSSKTPFQMLLTRTSLPSCSDNHRSASNRILPECASPAIQA